MHVCCYDELNENKNCTKIILSKDQFDKLIIGLEKSFQKDRRGDLIEIAEKNYSDNDAFFEATGNYHLFNTCNSWTNSTLKMAGIKTAFWTPFDKGILYHLD